MDKIPTAVNIFRKNMKPSQPIRGDVTDSVLEAMIEFAKLHVKAALEAAAKQATCTAYYPPKKMEYDEDDKLILKDEEASYVFPVQGGSKWIDIKKSSILNAYPDKLII